MRESSKQRTRGLPHPDCPPEDWKDLARASAQPAASPALESVLFPDQFPPPSVPPPSEQALPAQESQQADEDRHNFALARDGAKLIAANKEAKKASAVLDSDGDTFCKNECKADKWIIIELSQVAKVDAVELSQFELYSSRVHWFDVRGRQHHPRHDGTDYSKSLNSTQWRFMGQFEAANVKGTQAFRMPSPAWVKYLQLRFISHHGTEAVCALNDIHGGKAGKPSSVYDVLVAELRALKVQQKALPRDFAELHRNVTAAVEALSRALGSLAMDVSALQRIRDALPESPSTSQGSTESSTFCEQGFPVQSPAGAASPVCLPISKPESSVPAAIYGMPAATSAAQTMEDHTATRQAPAHPGSLVLGQLGLFRNKEELEKLSELGVLFLLFEMGLELSVDRLKALAKYAFGLGTITMALSTFVFTAFALPVGHGVGTLILTNIFHTSPQLASIRSVDEAIVIGAALSLSSSAFVLQLLNERGEMSTKFGAATLGILLLQDIAVVPFLVLLPLIEGTDLMADGQSPISLLAALGPTALKTVGGLSLLLLGGRYVLRSLFELVAAARSDETFVALCLLTVTGAALTTQRLGFSDTLGAFCAGVLLSETNFRTQVEADIRPFRGMLLGLFFVSTGGSLDLQLLLHEWPIVMFLLVGLLATKVGIIGTVAQFFGLSRHEAIRTGFMLSQGGEFAFVLLSLANKLHVLPEELNRVLIIVVVLSMALTPTLAEAGKKLADLIATEPAQQVSGSMDPDGSSDINKERPVIICGFGELGQALANVLDSPMTEDMECGTVPYVGFDIHHDRVQKARRAGFNVLYGDASRLSVLKAAHVEPSALAVCFTARNRAITTVRVLRDAFPGVPIFARALDTRHAADMKHAGADTVYIANAEAGVALAGGILAAQGVNAKQVNNVAGILRHQMDQRAQALVAESGKEGAPTSSDDDIFRLDKKLLPEAREPMPAASPMTDAVMKQNLNGKGKEAPVQPEADTREMAPVSKAEMQASFDEKDLDAHPSSAPHCDIEAHQRQEHAQEVQDHGIRDHAHNVNGKEMRQQAREAEAAGAKG
ncbi:hypothetical protein WJX73_001117 [Symbiochloris irregularis]|uniref:K(+) efflux antiporter 3, chloroplastic n=1 Tax=Symbiochloris irregularis TaxID=706552 RepID=A0AAW1P139_9CHLO